MVNHDRSATPRFRTTPNARVPASRCDGRRGRHAGLLVLIGSCLRYPLVPDGGGRDQEENGGDDPKMEEP